MNVKSLIGKDFISILDYSKDELELILDIAADLKRRQQMGMPHELLKGKTLGMLFAHPSTRTRISFETAMTQLGGHAQFYDPSTLQLANKETFLDTAEMMGRFIDAIMIRLYNQEYYGKAREILRDMAKVAPIPVVNALDDKEHPCQIMADILTMREKFGADYKKKKIVIGWAYDERLKSQGVAQTMAAAGGVLGMDLVLAYPKGYDLDPDYINFANKTAEETGAKITVEHDIWKACDGADVIYCKSWKSMSMSKEEDMDFRKDPKVKEDWCITKKHFDIANKGATYMHCLPAARGNEVTDDVIDGPMSIVNDQAENRLHVQKAILALTVGH
jgi:ornithine carbamoyltransferase